MFGVGRKVEYIGGHSLRNRPRLTDVPKIGVVYTVSNVFVTHHGVEHLELHELHAPQTSNVYAGYRSTAFRPLTERKTDIGFAHEILRKVTRKDRVRV